MTAEPPARKRKTQGPASRSPQHGDDRRHIHADSRPRHPPTPPGEPPDEPPGEPAPARDSPRLAQFHPLTREPIPGTTVPPPPAPAPQSMTMPPRPPVKVRLLVENHGIPDILRNIRPILPIFHLPDSQSEGRVYESRQGAAPCFHGTEQDRVCDQRQFLFGPGSVRHMPCDAAPSSMIDFNLRLSAPCWARCSCVSLS